MSVEEYEALYKKAMETDNMPLLEALDAIKSTIEPLTTAA